MINERQIERLTELVANKIEELNVLILKRIGNNIKQLGELTPTKAHELAQILKYGGSYDEIVKEISETTKLNARQINEIFYEFAKKDQEFYKAFYKYRKIPYVPIEKNVALRKEVMALANITKKEMVNFSRTSALGFMIRNEKGKLVHVGLKKTYYKLIDEAVLNVSQGKETFDEALFSRLKQIGSSGLKTLEFESGRSVRLDSAMRMNMQDALRNLHNELQQQFGEEFGADGVEISVHLNPAPDHAEVQGHQFSKKEFEKFQNDEDAKDYKGRLFPAEFNGHDRRSIGEYNCYHYVFPIVLGVNKAEYSSEQLQEIIQNNKQGFGFEGKHYTNYEGTQLQRKLETAIRKQKDLQILGKESDNKKLILESQNKITQLSQKYNELCQVSGLPRKADRLRVPSYKRVAKSKLQ